MLNIESIAVAIYKENKELSDKLGELLDIFPTDINDDLMLSSYNTFKKFLDLDHEYLLWTDNNLDILPQFPYTISHYFSNIDFDFDAISLHVPDEEVNKYVPSNDTMGNHIFTKAYFNIHPKALLLSKSGMQKFIAQYDKNKTDITLTGMLNTFSVKPEFRGLFRMGGM